MFAERLEKRKVVMEADIQKAKEDFLDTLLARIKRLDDRDMDILFCKGLTIEITVGNRNIVDEHEMEKYVRQTSLEDNEEIKIKVKSENNNYTTTYRVTFKIKK